MNSVCRLATRLGTRFQALGQHGGSNAKGPPLEGGEWSYHFREKRSPYASSATAKNHPRGPGAVRKRLVLSIACHLLERARMRICLEYHFGSQRTHYLSTNYYASGFLPENQ
jgi:hypothetical protein